MLNVIKIIQAVLFTIGIMVPIGFICCEPLLVGKKNQKFRFIVFSITILISIIAFLIMSVYITSNDETYKFVDYEVFHQCWFVIRKSLLFYSAITAMISMLIGLAHINHYICDKKRKINVGKYFGIPKSSIRMTKKEAELFPTLKYEIYVEPNLLHNYEYIVSMKAYDEFIKLMKLRTYNSKMRNVILSLKR